MTEIDRQTLSTLIDGETGPRDLDRAIDQLLGDESLRQDWERYQLIGRVIRGDSVNLEVRSLADRLRIDIQAEQGARVVSFHAVNKAFGRKQRLLRMVPLTSALAAGLALFAVMLVPGGGFLGVPGSQQSESQLIAEGPRWQRQDPDLRNKLDQLVVSHREQGGRGLPGSFSYASVVGQTGEY